MFGPCLTRLYSLNVTLTTFPVFRRHRQLLLWPGPPHEAPPHTHDPQSSAQLRALQEDGDLQTAQGTHTILIGIRAVTILSTASEMFTFQRSSE